MTNESDRQNIEGLDVRLRRIEVIQKEHTGLLLLLPELSTLVSHSMTQWLGSTASTLLYGGITTVGVGVSILGLAGQFDTPWLNVLALVFFIFAALLIVEHRRMVKLQQSFVTSLPDDFTDAIKDALRSLHVETAQHYASYPADKPRWVEIEEHLGVHNR